MEMFIYGFGLGVFLFSAGAAWSFARSVMLRFSSGYDKD